MQRCYIASIPIRLDVHTVLSNGQRMFTIFCGACTIFLRQQLDISMVPFGKLQWMTITAAGCKTFEHFKTFAASYNLQRVMTMPERVAAVHARCLASDG